MSAKSKIFPSFAEAVRDIPDGATIGFGGFAVVGVPINLYGAVAAQGAKGLTCVSNSTRGGATLPPEAPDMGQMIQNGQVKKVVCAFTAPTRASQRLILTEYVEKGLIEAELTPQGTLAERMRAAGAGIPAFYTPAAVGTELAEGRDAGVQRPRISAGARPAARLRDDPRLSGRRIGQSALPALAAQFQPDHGDGGARHDRRGRGGHPADRRDRPRRRAHGGNFRASHRQDPAAARGMVAAAAAGSTSR